MTLLSFLKTRIFLVEGNGTAESSSGASIFYFVIAGASAASRLVSHEIFVSLVRLGGRERRGRPRYRRERCGRSHGIAGIGCRTLTLSERSAQKRIRCSVQGMDHRQNWSTENITDARRRLFLGYRRRTPQRRGLLASATEERNTEYYIYIH